MNCASYWAPPAGGYSGGHPGFPGGYPGAMQQDPLYPGFFALAGAGYPRFLAAMIQDPLYADFLGLARAGYPDFLGAMIEDPLSPDFLAGAQIDANQLREYLKSRGFFGSCYPFSLETCRLMILMLNQHFSGKIGFYEFKGLLILLKQWEGTFIECSTDQSGTLGRDEFRAALSSLGYRLSFDDVNMIANRYPPYYRITFDEFVAWCVHLKPSTGFHAM